MFYVIVSFLSLSLLLVNQGVGNDFPNVDSINRIDTREHVECVDGRPRHWACSRCQYRTYKSPKTAQAKVDGEHRSPKAPVLSQSKDLEEDTGKGLPIDFRRCIDDIRASDGRDPNQSCECIEQFLRKQ